MTPTEFRTFLTDQGWSADDFRQFHNHEGHTMTTTTRHYLNLLGRASRADLRAWRAYTRTETYLNQRDRRVRTTINRHPQPAPGEVISRYSDWIVSTGRRVAYAFKDTRGALADMLANMGHECQIVTVSRECYPR